MATFSDIRIMASAVLCVATIAVRLRAAVWTSRTHVGADSKDDSNATTIPPSSSSLMSFSEEVNEASFYRRGLPKGAGGSYTPHRIQTSLTLFQPLKLD
jgi:hypothetical protein